MTVTISTGQIRVLNDGIAASITAYDRARRRASRADFTLGLGSITFEINTTHDRAAAHAVARRSPRRTLRVRVQDAGIVVLGQSLHVGEFTFEQTTTAANTKVVRIGFTDVDLADRNRGRVGIPFQDISGALLITPQGIAGKLTGHADGHAARASRSAATSTVEFNRSRVAVHETIGTPPARPRAPARSSASPRTHLTVTIDGTSVTARLLLRDRDSAPTTTNVTKIGVANLSFAGQITGARGALLILPELQRRRHRDRRRRDGHTSPGTAARRVGFSINTLSEPDLHGCLASTPRPSPKCVDVDEHRDRQRRRHPRPGEGPREVRRRSSRPNFNFGDVLEVRGDFRARQRGAFSGQGLEIFLGKGPSLINGSPNPDAIGLLVTNASFDFQRLGSGYALYASGTLALVGLDGLTVQGTVTFQINTTLQSQTVGGHQINPNTFAFEGTGIVFSVAGVFTVSGNLSVTRQPNGTLDVSMSRRVDRRDGRRPGGRLAPGRRGLLDQPAHRLPALDVQGRRLQDLRRGPRRAVQLRRSSRRSRRRPISPTRSTARR